MQTRSRISLFLQNVLHITALHIITDTKLELVKNLSWLFDPELVYYPVYPSYKMGPAGQMIVHNPLLSSPRPRCLTPHPCVQSLARRPTPMLLPISQGTTPWYLFSCLSRAHLIVHLAYFSITHTSAWAGYPCSWWTT
jgi:hypothetical protein